MSDDKKELLEGLDTLHRTPTHGEVELLIVLLNWKGE